ncbi:hypothetical protein QTJ16_001200 [Diplocarpon rosae]|uniref:3',5'-cyclic-nucleotide phosphodiesterase n=1 Tax=Diplocarpon rosae TaxID=946125 RepID=A0AAD9T895_9HELO|nr:hypothetical protein QTJ16_001200 [Diplocarpon rosae]
MEDNVTAFLVRATSTGWKKGSILAVDAGVHLAAIRRMLETHKQSRPWEPEDLVALPPRNSPRKPVTLVDGPFEGLELPNRSAKANAGYIHRELIECLLLTHPHLDHSSGFIINTAGLPSTRQKRIAGLPSTIDALKTHIFNNVIWPNLSDENNGAGLITYMRLVEGGSPAFGEGDSRGYVEVCDGLSIKTLTVTHGHCIEKHAYRSSAASPNVQSWSPKISISERSPRLLPSAYPMQRNSSTASGLGEDSRTDTSHDRCCVYDSSAYFIRDISTGKEVLIFGDVEPDSVSLQPRNYLVWAEAAPKIVSGSLGGVLIECSYDNSRADDLLFGHLKPQHLIDELTTLAEKVVNCRKGAGASSKRKRSSNGTLSVTRNLPKAARHHSPPVESPSVSPLSTRSRRDHYDPSGTSPVRDGPIESKVSRRRDFTLPLQGVKIVIIHVKGELKDGPGDGEVILEQLRELEEQAALGCEFVLASSGQSVYF